MPYENPEWWGSNPHREALKQMNMGEAKARRASEMRCEYKGCTSDYDYFCTDTFLYLCKDHIDCDEED